jgi:hypothetical protein
MLGWLWEWSNGVGVHISVSPDYMLDCELIYRTYTDTREYLRDLEMFVYIHDSHPLV